MKIKKESWLLPVIFGSFMVLSFVWMRIICRGKYDFLHIIANKVAFPPMWIFNFLYMITLFLAGAAAGFFIGNAFCHSQSIQTENLFLKGTIFFVAIYFLSLLWYPALMVLQMPIFSLILSIFSVVCVIITIAFWIKASFVYTVFMMPYAIFVIYLNVLNFILVFTI